MIRQAKRADLAVCAGVIRESFQTVADAFGFTAENAPRFTAFATTEERLIFQLEQERRCMYLEEEDGAARGFYSLRQLDDGACELANLSVLPAFRHQGIGGRLLRHAADTAREQGCGELRFGIVEENTRLREWYERNGAVHTGAEKFDFFPFTCGFMRIRLSEKSCGAVVFKLNGADLRFLLVRGRDGFWGFPKGHVEKGETERQTALREIREETGLRAALVEGFRTEDQHRLAREGFPNTVKQNVYFLGSYADQPVTPQASEIADWALLDYDAALALLQTEGFRRVLTEAHDFLLG